MAKIKTWEPSFYTETMQKRIADEAKAEFKETWLKNKGSRPGDGEWLEYFNRLRIKGKGVCREKLDRFLDTFQIARPFPIIARDSALGVLNDHLKEVIVNPVDLANAWVKRKRASPEEENIKGTITLKVSAESKILFFARPDNERLVIYDSKAARALKERHIVEGKPAPRTYADFRDAVLELDKQLRRVHWTPLLDSKPGVSPDFISRRLTDKHLFIEGDLLEAADAIKAASKTFKHWKLTSKGRSLAEKHFGSA